MAYQPAVLGTARLNNFRLNYLSAALRAVRETRARITIADVAVTGRVRLGSTTIHDVINDAPNTAGFVIYGDPPPQVDQIVRITINSNAPRLLFDGVIESLELTYVGKPTNPVAYTVRATDDSPRANARLPFGVWSNLSATTVAQQLLAQFAPAFSAAGIQAGLAPVSINLDGSEGINGALRQIVKLIGGYFYWEDFTLHLFTSAEAGDLPDAIDGTPHRFADDPHIVAKLETTQIRTRVYGKGHGENTLADVLAGDTIIPIADAVMFNVAGGRAISLTQRLAYTGIQLGGGGTIVGAGVFPTAVVSAAVAAGGSVTVGVHSYAVTYLTAGGESLPGPQTGITVGTLAGPASAPVAGTPTAGSGPDVGSHQYAVSFVTATGETVPGPTTSVTTGTLTGPAAAPSVQSIASGSGPEPGSHQYAVSFVTATGETTPGPAVSTSIADGVTAPPAQAPNLSNAQPGGNIDAGPHDYCYTFVTATGETVGGAISSQVATTNGVAQPTAPLTNPSFPAGGLQAGYYGYSYTIVTGSGESMAVTPRLVVHLGSTLGVSFDIPAASDPAVISRRVYRTYAQGTNAAADSQPLWQLGTVAGSGAVRYTDTTSDPAWTGTVNPPNTNNAGGALKTINLNMILPGPAEVTARRIYRRDTGFGFRFLTAINDNVNQTFSDTIPTASLGAAPPASNTATTQIRRVTLATIPLGGAGVTQRKLYRSSANTATPLKLLATLADNVTTTYVDATSDAALGAAALGSSTALACVVPLSAIPLGPPGVTSRKLYRSRANATALFLVTPLGDNATTTYSDTLTDAGLGAAAPTTGTATGQTVNLGSIQVGPSSVTARKIYRTAAGQAQLQLLATLADNATTTYVDTLADASLGANVPTGDTSGLAPAAGIVVPGAASMPVAGAGAFSATGGWAIIGNGQQTIRYTATSGNTLIGIPASGTGAIIAAVAYNSTITAAPALVGVSGLGLPLVKGDPVNLWVQRDDTAAQAELAARASTPTKPHDGIVEHRIADERRAEASLRQYCDADLALFSRPIKTVTYTCRDVKTKSGKPVTFNLSSPSIQGTLTIQDVTITQIDQFPGVPPKFAVSASSVRYTIEDLLARLAETLEGT